MADVYDKEKEKQGEKNTGQHDDLGVDPDQRAAEVSDLEDQFAAPSAEKSESGALGSKDLESAEESAEEPETTSADSTGDNDDQIGEGFKNDEKPKRRFSLTKKQKIVGGGVTGLIVGGGFALLTFFSGPLQIVHFSQLLQRFHFSNDSQFMDNRAGKIIKWAKTRNATERRHMGYFGNKLADHYATKFKEQGMETKYNRAGRIDSIEIDTNTEAGKTARSKMEAAGAKIETDGSSKVKVNLEGETAKLRRSAIKGMIDASDLGKVSSVVAGRLSKVRAAVDFHPLKNIARSADEKLYSAYAKKVQEKRNKVRNGGTDEAARAPEEPKADSDAGKAVDEAATEAAGEVAPEAKASKLSGRLKTGALVIPLVCGLYKIGESIPNIKHFKIVMPLIRTGMNIITMGAQVQSGQGFNINELGVISKDFYDEASKTSFLSAADIQSELGQPATGPKMPLSINTDQPDFFAGISSAVEAIKIPGLDVDIGKSTCNILTTRVGGIIADVAGAFMAASGPVGFAVSFIGSQVGGSLIGSFTNNVIDSLIVGAKQNVKGALLGSYGNYGARLAANDQAIAHGGTELTTTDSVALKEDRNELFKNELQHKSLFARYLDLSEPDSVASKTVFENPDLQGPQAVIASLISNPFKVFSSLARNLIPKVSAATTYDYGFPEFGFTLDELNDPDNLYDDPYAIAKEIEDNSDPEYLAKLNEKYGKPCFGLTINPDTGTLEPGNDTKKYNDIKPECKVRSNPELTKYRYYLVDMTTQKSLLCYEGLDEASCTELGFDANSSQTPTTPPQGGLETPPNMGGEIANGYYKMPDATQEEYVISSPDNNRCGSVTLINTIYTVSKRWYAKYPNSKIRIGDLNAAAGHASHMNGVDVDIYTVDKSAADMGGDAEKSKELGRMFADTGVIKVIFYNDTAVQNDFNAYIQSKGLPSKMESWPGHENHFHVRILDDFRLKTSGGCSES